MEASVTLFDLKDLGNLKGKQLRKQVLEKVTAAKGGAPPPDDHVDFFQTRAGVVALAHEDPLETLTLLDDLRPFFDRVQIGLIDANEVSLMNLVRQAAPGDDQVTAIIYVGEEFSRAIFMRGGDYLGLTQVINEGAHSPQVLNTLYSRILFEQDTSHLPEINRILLAGEARNVDAQAFFTSQFPDAGVDYLIPSGIDLSPVQDRERVSEFDIPIGLAWKALEPRNERFYPANFLSRERKRLQNPLEIAWHGLLLVALIAATALLFGMRVWEQGRSIATVKRSIQLKERQIQENSVYITLVDSLHQQIGWYRQSLAVTDTLSSHYRAWSHFLWTLSDETHRVNSLWFTGLNGKGEGIALTGRSIYRDRIPSVAWKLRETVVRRTTRSQIRTQDVYDFDLEVKSFTSLSQDTLEALPTLSLDRMEETPATPEAADVSSPSAPRYIVHVGIFKDQEAADREVAHLSQKGYLASASAGRETRWGRFLVHVGGFESLEEARRAGERLKREEGIDAWIYKWRDGAGPGDEGR
jgi:Tfp pilus assembly protein PilN